MNDACTKCGSALEPGDVKCPACGTEVPAPVAPPVNKAMVLFAALLPVLALLFIFTCLAGIALAVFKYSNTRSHAVTTSEAISQPAVGPEAPVTSAPPPATAPCVARYKYSRDAAGVASDCSGRCTPACGYRSAATGRFVAGSGVNRLRSPCRGARNRSHVARAGSGSGQTRAADFFPRRKACLSENHRCHQCADSGCSAVSFFCR